MTTATMDALVVHAPNRYSIEQVAMPSPQPYEALCRVRAVAICGTDAHIINGDFPGFWPPAMPFTPGHEWAGDIVGLGQNAELFGWKVGDRVAGSSHAGCGYCRQCQLGRYQLCDNYGRPDVHSQYGHNKPGAYAGYVVQSIKSLTHIPDTMSYDLAAMCDSTSIAMHTVNRAQIRPGTNAAVFGAGVMGLLVAECARVVGAARVIVVGRGERLKRAAALGFETVDSTVQDRLPKSGPGRPGWASRSRWNARAQPRQFAGPSTCCVRAAAARSSAFRLKPSSCRSSAWC